MRVFSGDGCDGGGEDDGGGGRGNGGGGGSGGGSVDGAEGPSDGGGGGDDGGGGGEQAGRQARGLSLQFLDDNCLLSFSPEYCAGATPTGRTRNNGVRSETPRFRTYTRREVATSRLQSN